MTEEQRKELLRSSRDPALEQVRRLLRLKGIGMNSAWVDVMGFFAWRAFHNRREVGISEAASLISATRWNLAKKSPFPGHPARIASAPSS